MKMNVTVSTFLTLLFTIQLCAQYQIGLIPRTSPDKATYQKIGFTEVEIKYGSPSVNGRKILGDLEPYDEVWRAGANEATTISFSLPVKINDSMLDSGRYALFIVPRKNQRWTVIFNKEWDQWGAFRYNSADDALRVDVVPKKNEYLKEELTYSIEQFGYEYGSILLNWEHVKLEIPFETNYITELEKLLKDRVVKLEDHLSWVAYLQGAEHLEQINNELLLAREWIDHAESILESSDASNEKFFSNGYVIGHLYWTKAKILAATNDKSGAIEYANKMRDLPDALFYKRNIEKENMENLISSWSEQ